MLDARMRPHLDDLIALALDAGREIMRVREAGFDAMMKGDGSPVTIADQRAEAIIEAGLARLAPGVPMIGEEAVASGRVPLCGEQFFSVDPLDGTRGFVEGGAEFTVNIALIENGAPVQGVIYSPVSREVFAGEPGRALKGLDAATTAIATQAPGDTWRVIASVRSGRGPQTARFVDALGAHTLVHAASSIKFCRIAEGAADLYPRFGEMSEWDAAAGHAILNAAGGGVMNLAGATRTYGRRDAAFLVDGLIAYGSEAARAAALEAFKRSGG
jgi:3'(2'),5'-bisphosphate nucleotidase